jgi:hypothetical protein
MKGYLRILARRWGQTKTAAHGATVSPAPVMESPSFACPAQQEGKPLCFISPPQMRPPPVPVVGGAGSVPVAVAAPAPATAGCRQRLRRRRERGEGKEVEGGGMRASDIDGIGGPSNACPGSVVVAAPAPVVGCAAAG